jgi:hypothetical protein
MAGWRRAPAPSAPVLPCDARLTPKRTAPFPAVPNLPRQEIKFTPPPSRVTLRPESLTPAAWAAATVSLTAGDLVILLATGDDGVIELDSTLAIAGDFMVTGNPAGAPGVTAAGGIGARRGLHGVGVGVGAGPGMVTIRCSRTDTAFNITCVDRAPQSFEGPRGLKRVWERYASLLGRRPGFQGHLDGRVPAALAVGRLAGTHPLATAPTLWPEAGRPRQAAARASTPTYPKRKRPTHKGRPARCYRA